VLLAGLVALVFLVGVPLGVPIIVPVVLALLAGLRGVTKVRQAAASAPGAAIEDVSATVSTDVVIRGVPLEVDLAQTAPGQMWYVGVRCIELTDADFSTSESTQRRTSEAVEVWEHAETDAALARQTVSLTVPADAPFTLDATPVGYRWSVEVRSPDDRGGRALSAPLTVLP
jgi:hypothetical protein